MRNFVLLTLMITVMFYFISCNMNTSKVEENDYDDFICGPLETVVFFIPMDGIKDSEIEKLKTEFQERVQYYHPGLFVETLEHFNTPDSCINSLNNKIDENILTSVLENNFLKMANEKAVNEIIFDKKHYGGCFIIGVTDKNIETKVHGLEKYKIPDGSEYERKQLSVITTKGPTKKKDLWKLAFHEFNHGYNGIEHCSNNSCIMSNYKGKNPHFERKDSLCLDCSVQLIIGD
ncbi:MAG: hypothetical protein J1D77_01420 [Muribaculaceae bacterium]|nr:hypothetical protein [Muribaculaceae bacterium]